MRQSKYGNSKSVVDPADVWYATIKLGAGPQNWRTIGMNYGEIRQRMDSGRLYYCDNEEMMQDQIECLDRLFEYNQLKLSRQAEKKALLKKMFGQIGENCYIETPFHANWGGKNAYFGNNVYVNFNLVMVDDGDIRVGNYVMIGPNVVLCSTNHPIDPKIRKKTAQYSLPVRIEDNVWLGANCVVLPGVTIGENSVIGAGSVVTKDIPANVVAVGCPCRVLREINENDRKYFNKGQLIDLE